MIITINFVQTEGQVKSILIMSILFLSSNENSASQGLEKTVNHTGLKSFWPITYVNKITILCATTLIR